MKSKNGGKGSGKRGWGDSKYFSSGRKEMQFLKRHEESVFFCFSDHLKKSANPDNGIHFPGCGSPPAGGSSAKRKRRRKSASPGREAPPRAGRFISGIREKPHEKRKNPGKAKKKLRIRKELDDSIACYLGFSPYTFRKLSKHNLSHYPRFREDLKADR